MSMLFFLSGLAAGIAAGTAYGSAARQALKDDYERIHAHLSLEIDRLRAQVADTIHKL